MAKGKGKPLPRSGGGGISSGRSSTGGPAGGGLGGLGGLGAGGASGLMAQVQKMQQDMATAQEELKQTLSETIIDASVGGGMVSVKMTAAQELVSIEIKPDVVDPDDVETLQDLITAAVREATNKAKSTSEQMTEEKMAPFASMLDMGGLGGLF